MPRTANESSKRIAADLAMHIERLVTAARTEGREGALAEIRGLISGTKSSGIETGNPRRPGPTRGRRSAVSAGGTKRRSSWARLSPEARLKRVNAIRVGRGLAPKRAL